MDPLSITASIAGLISFTDMIAVKSYKYIKEARDASEEVKRLMQEITDLFGILNSLRMVASRYEDEDFDSTVQSHHIYSCHALLEKIKSRLDKADPHQVDENKSPFRQKASILGRTLTWPFSSAETKRLVDEVAHQKATLSLALAADGMNTLLECLSNQKAQGDDIVEIRDNVRAQRAEQALRLLGSEKNKILDTIGTFDPSGHQNTAIKLRQPGTGVWFMEGTQFKHWLETPNAKLWLYGIPGAGKTILTSSIIQVVGSQAKPADGIAYFYCDYKDPKTHDPLVILGALVRQLAMQNPRCFETLEKFYSVYYTQTGSTTGHPVTPEHLCSLIQSISAFFDEVLIIIDALDEVGNDRCEVVEFLARLNSDEVNIKTLFTSRLETDIELHLDSYEKVSIAAASSDLKLYVASEIESRTRKGLLQPKDPNLKKEILDRLVDGAEGMFRWVTCQLDYLCELNTDRAIRKALGSLPPTLFATYERILDRVNASSADTQQLVERVLKLIVCSKELLSTEELLEAVSISEGDTELDHDGIPNEERILKWCSSLVRRTPNGQRLELAHFTVEEFLLAIDASKFNSPYARYKISPEKEDLLLAKLCLTYLLFSDFGNNKWTIKGGHGGIIDRDKYRFYHYSARNWADHSKAHRNDQGVLDLVKILFDPSKTGNFIRWSCFWASIDNDSNDLEQISDTETLHFAAAFSLYHICEWLIKENGRITDIDKISGIGTPLYCALRADKSFEIPNYLAPHNPNSVYDQNRRKTVEYLLDAGARIDNIKVHPNVDWTPLTLALKVGICWDYFLDKGVVLDESCLELVEHMVKGDDALAVEPFLLKVSDKNLDKHIMSRYINLALQIKSTHQQVVNMMSRANGVARSISFADSSALLKAAAIGQIRVVQELLNQPEIDISFRDHYGRVALHYACENGHFEAVELLVEHGASIEATDNKGKTPLLLSASTECLHIIQYLEEKGCNINTVTKDGQTVLHISATSNCVSALQEFLQMPRLKHSLLSRTKNGRTVLLCAVEAGSLKTAQFILDRSSHSDILSKSDDGHTCLHYAAISRKVKMFALFQHAGIYHHSQTNNGFTALHYAAKCSEASLFHAVLNHIDQATLTARDIFAHPTLIETRASLQCSNGAWSVDDFISGRRLNLPSSSGRTPLQLLLSEDRFNFDHDQMVQDLASRIGIDLEHRDREGKAPIVALASRLSYTAYSSTNNKYIRRSMKDLLSRGVDINTQDVFGRTVLHYLCDARLFSSDIFDAISDIIGSSTKSNTVRVDIRDVWGESPLQALFKNAHKTQSHRVIASIGSKMLGMASKDEIDRYLPDGNRLFNLAIKLKNDMLIEEIYNLGAKMEERDNTNERRSPLELFCIHGTRDIGLLKKLINACRSLSELDFTGLSLLHLAARYGHINAARELINGGLDVNVRSREGKTALLDAVAAGDSAIVGLLLDSGSTRDCTHIDSQNPMASLSCHVSNEDICRLLDKRGLIDWAERISCIFRGPYVPGFATSGSEASRSTLWSSLPIPRVTPLHYYATCPSPDMFRYAFERVKDADVDIEADFGIRPLFLAIFNMRYSVVEYLLEHGANPNSVYKPTRWTMLHLAAHLGADKIIAVLLTYKADPRAEDASDLTPSLIAWQQGHSRIAEELEEAEELQQSNQRGYVRDSQNKSLSPTLAGAIDRGDLKLCQQLVGRCFSIDGTFACGCTALVKACGSHKLDIAAYLMNLGVSVNGGACLDHGKSSMVGFTALHFAAFYGDLKLFKNILKQHPDVSESIIQPIHLAARHGHLDVLRFIIDSAKDRKLVLEAQTPKANGQNGAESFLGEFVQCCPLHIAISFGHLEAVEYLLRAGADLEARDELGWTPLLFALQVDDHIVLNMLSLLIEAGANIHTRDNYGDTPLITAARTGSIEVVNYLISLSKNELDLRATNIVGRTALYYAIDAEKLDIAKALIQAGLSFTETDTLGDTPVQLSLVDDSMVHLALENLPEVDMVRSKIEGSILNEASLRGREQVVNELLKRVPEADVKEYVNLQCNIGTPLYSAAHGGYIPIMEKLIEHGAEINLVGGSIGSPLIAACAIGQAKAVAWLLRKGAKLQCTKLDGTTVTAEQAAQGHEIVLSVLRRFREEGIQALDEEIPVMTADITKLDDFMSRHKEQKKEQSEANS